MTLLLPILYHWAPTDRRDGIWRAGLQPYSPPVCHSGDLAYPYICLATTPSSAWGLSGDLDHVSEVESWDLWQARLEEGDEVHYRSDFGPVLREIRVRSPIPGDRLWYVATREIPAARQASR